MRLQVHQVRLNDGRDALAVSILPNEEVGHDDLVPTYGHLEAVGTDNEAYAKTSDEPWRRLIPIGTALLEGERERDGESSCPLSLQPTDRAWHDSALYLPGGMPGPPPFLVDINDVEPGEYLMTIAEVSATVRIAHPRMSGADPRPELG